MGWSTGWSIMQEQVIGLYNLLGPDGFTSDVCKVIMRPFIGTDMDSGGKDDNLVTKDGKTEEVIVVDAMCPDFDALVSYVSSEYDSEDMTDDKKIYDAYYEKFHDLFDDKDIWK